MNRTLYYSAHTNLRSNWQFAMKMLFPGERQVMAKVMSLRMPTDKLQNRMEMSRAFKEARSRGVPAPKSQLVNEYVMSGKITCRTP